MALAYDIESILDRNLTRLVRNPTLLGTLLVEPVIFFLVFSQAFQKLGVFLPSSSGGYLAYLTPGILMMAALVTSPQSGVSFANDLNSGFLSKMLVTPVSRPAILLGRLMADIPVVVAQSAITLVAAIGLGVRISTGVAGVLLILLTVAFLELALSGVFLAVGMATRKTETVTALSGFLGLPLIFLSSTMFPISFLPSWAQTAADYNPFTYASNVARDLIQGGLTLGALASAYALIGIIAIASLAVTLYQFRKVVS